MELQRLSLSQGCQNCYFVFTQLEFLLANCHGAYGYQGHFFHYPRVCLQSHVGKLHLYLCQWKKFPSGNISRHQGKPFQFTEIERRGSLSCLRFLQLQPKKKKSCFISQRLAHHPPLPAQLGGPGWSVALHARYKLYSGHCTNPLHLFHSLLCSTNRRNKTSNSRMLHWEQAHSILSPLSCCSYYFNLLILQGTHQQQDSRPDLISKAMNVPPRAGKELIRVQGKLTGQCGRGAGALKQ